MEDILISIALILAVSFIFSELFFRIKYPRVIGQIIAGMILGLPLFSMLFTGSIRTDVEFLSDLGVIFLLLLTGLELNMDKFRKAEKDAIIIAAFCIFIPFILGFALMKVAGYSNVVAFILGASLSITAEGTTLKVLMDMRALNTKVGTIILGAGIFDDILEVLLLSIVLFMISGNISEIILFPFKIILFVAVAYLTYKIFPLGLRKIEREHSGISTFSFILLFGIIIAVVSKLLGLGPIIGAFIAGIIIHLAEHKKGEHHETVKELQIMTFSLIIPFFFINIGLHFDVSSLFSNWWLIFMVLLIANAGKILGAIMATPFTDLTLSQTHLIGWGMNSRGAVELVVAELARSYGLIPPEIYSAIVTMAIITTLSFPIAMRLIINKNRKVLQ